VPGRLLETLSTLLTDPSRLAKMGERARMQAHPDAAERIADRLSRLAVAGKIP